MNRLIVVTLWNSFFPLPDARAGMVGLSAAAYCKA